MQIGVPEIQIVGVCGLIDIKLGVLEMKKVENQTCDIL